MKNLSVLFASSVFAVSVFSSQVVMAQAAAPAAAKPAAATPAAAAATPAAAAPAAPAAAAPAPEAPAAAMAPAAPAAPKKPVNIALNNARVKAAVVGSLVSDKKKELDKEKAAPTPDAAKVDKMIKDLAALEKRLVAANAVAVSAEKSK
ncbi:MAG: hypothetical protein QE278_14450 [Limnobacter sp.]|nr:hypothetical protein [Limnobacter sp.]